MKNYLLLMFIFLLVPEISFSQDSCPPLDQKFLIVYSNGILTSKEDAERSLLVLANSIGPSHNGEQVTYNIAYNHTEGPIADLLQSLDRELTQYDSEVMLWLSDKATAPGWFTSLIQRLLLTDYQWNAGELTDHVDKYRQAVLRGQKALVVSHSQGNFYVNEAKQILATVVPQGALDAFGIFVDTYMSDRLGIPDSLITEIKAQLNQLRGRIPKCENYRRQFMELLNGSYTLQCGLAAGEPSLSTVSIEAATVSSPFATVDLSLPDVWIDIGRDIVTHSEVRKPRIGFSAVKVGASGQIIGADWDPSGQVKSFGHFSEDTMQQYACMVDQETPPSAIPRPVNIASKVTELLDGYRGGFPREQCLFLDKASNQLSWRSGWAPLSVTGGVLTFDGINIDLAAEVVEGVHMRAYSPSEEEPRFVFVSERRDGDLWFAYRSMQGVTGLIYDTPTTRYTCGGDLFL